MFVKVLRDTKIIFNIYKISFLVEKRHIAQLLGPFKTDSFSYKRKFSFSPVSLCKPEIMKIDSPEFKSVFTPEFDKLIEIFRRYDYEIRIVGGAVRDILLGIHPKDIDCATNATPDQMKQVFEKEEIRVINMKGEKHGTVTARINNQNFEVTTLRVDLVTDGRHAEVMFTNDWKLDALRRDLTINSLSLGTDGTLYDYFGGYEDLLKRKIVFVGDADSRIKEDYLRILRYFRFYGRVAKKECDYHEETISAIKDNISGLGMISGERIWTELQKIVTGNFACSLIEKIVEVGACSYIGLPEKPNLSEMTIVLSRSMGLELKPITIIASLLHNADQLNDFNSRCKLSVMERNTASFIIEHRSEKRVLSTYQKLLLLPRKVPVTRDHLTQFFMYCGDLKMLSDFQSWSAPRFPISGYELTAIGVPTGRSVGVLLNRLKIYWIENNFEPTQQQLLEVAPSFAIESNIKLCPKI